MNIKKAVVEGDEVGNAGKEGRFKNKVGKKKPSREERPTHGITM